MEGADKAVAEALKQFAWVEEVPISITVCDDKGIILAMNKRSRNTFSNGEKSLIGKSLFDCHPPHAKAKIENLMKTHETNAYTIEKAGVKKLIYQAPWFNEGVFGGLVELSMVIPTEMPHFIRTPPPAGAPSGHPGDAPK